MCYKKLNNKYIIDTFVFSLKISTDKNMNIKNVVLILIASLLLSSCEKEEGVGGTSTIVGKIYVKEYNSSGDLKSEYYAPEEDVYIIYGDDDIYSDDFKTNYDGSYRFQYLRKGTYTIFAYSEDEDADAEISPVMIEVEITKNNQTVEAEDIIITK